MPERHSDTRRLDGKVALVTGAARGQGRSHAVRLATAGADILAVDVRSDTDVGGRGYRLADAQDMETTVRLVSELGRRIEVVYADVRNLAQVEVAARTAVEALGRLDIVVANAGVLVIGRAHQLSPLDWDQVIATNLTGVWNTCRACIPHLLAHGDGGSIVMTSSTAGIKGVGNISAYSASKHGVVGLMKSLAVELGAHRIRVNAVAPSAVDTPMIQNAALYRLFRPDLDRPDETDVFDARVASHLLPVPFVEPLDVSHAVAFLVSDEARYITGTELKIDAGFTTR